MLIRGIISILVIAQFSGGDAATLTLTNEVNSRSSSGENEVSESTSTSKTVEKLETFSIGKNSAIYFSDTDSNINRQFEFKDQKPLTNWPKCGKNEWFYPGDVENDWVCDCRPGYVFYAADGNCYEAYQQGPCEENEILAFFENKAILKCITNECEEEGFVMFNGECSKFRSEDACLKMMNKFNFTPNRKMRLEVDPSSHQLACADETYGIVCIKNECKIVHNNKIYYSKNSITT